jgi:hypothetical protein
MFEVDIDKAANLLTIRYGGRIGIEEIHLCAERIQAGLGELRPDFRLLTDLTKLESMELECLPEIQRMMDVFNKHGVHTVVRVIPHSHKDIGLNIMSLFHYERRVRIVTCKTVEEAERILGR